MCMVSVYKYKGTAISNRKRKNEHKTKNEPMFSQNKCDLWKQPINSLISIGVAFDLIV